MWYKNFLKKLIIFDVLFGKNKRTLTTGGLADPLHYHFTPLFLEEGFTLPENYQYIVYGKLTIDETAIIDGQLVII